MTQESGTSIPAIRDPPALELQSVKAGYGKSPVVFDLSLAVQPGEIVSLIGPNASGKSTILKAICGLVHVWSGAVIFESEQIGHLPTARRAGLGISFVPQGRRVFRDLTVMENLEIGGFRLSPADRSRRVGRVLEIFGQLHPRRQQRAGSLSGGEQQMVALGRALVARPKLLLLDEPSLGLASNLVTDLFGTLEHINTTMGVTLVVAEQRISEVLAVSHRTYGVKSGRIAFVGTPGEIVRAEGRLKDLFV